MGFYFNMLEELNRSGVPIIVSIQDMFEGCDGFIHAITEIGNSSHCFTLLVPLAAAFDLQLACNLLSVCITGEWSCILLKWLLMEGRPYWWIRETDVYKKHRLSAPPLLQTTHTCETGAGSPSGHVLHTALIGYVLVSWLISKYESQSKFPRPGAARFKKCLWTCYGLLLLLVAVSRMYISAHFPHQCVLGALLGIPLAWVLTSEKSPVANWWKNASRNQLLFVALLITLTSLGAYWLQKLIGIDPQWSVRLAFKWCHTHQNLHVSTTNIYSLVRDCGSALGFAIACSRSKRLKEQRLGIPLGVLCALLLNVAVRTVQKSIPTSNVITFYSAHYFLHAGLPLLLLLTFPPQSRNEGSNYNNNNTSSSNRRRSSRMKRD